MSTVELPVSMTSLRPAHTVPSISGTFLPYLLTGLETGTTELFCFPCRGVTVPTGQTQDAKMSQTLTVNLVFVLGLGF